MGKIPHLFEPGSCYFTTSTTLNYHPYFQELNNAKIFLNVLQNVIVKYSIIIDEFVLMPHHFHLILVPKDTPLFKIVRDLKRGSSRLINQIDGISGRKIWMPDYRDDRIWDERELENKRKYICFNPVKKQLSETPEEYAFSSANIHLRKQFGLPL